MEEIATSSFVHSRMLTDSIADSAANITFVVSFDNEQVDRTFITDLVPRFQKSFHSFDLIKSCGINIKLSRGFIN